MEIRNILVTTDFSEDARKAYVVAARLAKNFGAKLHLVHAAEHLPWFCLAAEGLGGGISLDEFHDELKGHLKKEAGDTAFRDLELQTSLLSGDHPIQTLKRFEDEQKIDLAVLSTHGRTGFKHAVLGSFAALAVRMLSSPVLTVRDEDAGSKVLDPVNVLVPFDFSANAAAVLPMVRFLAAKSLPTFTFGFVVESVYPILVEPTAPAIFGSIHDMTAEAPKVARRKFDHLKQEDLRGVNAQIEVRKGRPADELLRLADDSKADLILMATHGWSGLRHFVLGSVAETIVRKARCPVLTVRACVEPAPGSPERILAEQAPS